MSRMKKLHYIVFLLFSGTAWCQNNNSPFSIIGIGDIENNYYNRTSGMANTGQAYRSERYLINNNPASYTALQQQYLHFELSGRGQFVTYTGDPLNGVSNSSKDFAVKRLAIGTKVTNWWGTSVGLMPFSSSNYSLTSVKNIQGSSTALPVQYDGNGGINQVYFGNGFQVTKHFSVGVNASYLFGSLTQTETLSTADLQTSLVTTRQLYLRKLYLTYGAQYYFAVNKKWDIALGGTYSNKTDLATQSTVQITNNGVVIPNTPGQQDGTFKIPGATNVGFRIMKNKKYSFVADYQYQPWSNTNYSGTNYTLQNSSRVSAGFEISNKKPVFKTEYEKTFFQAGLYYGNSYLNVNGRQVIDMGLSLGYGLTSFKNPLSMVIALELGQRGTTQNGLVKESYVNINFTISHIDQLLTKGRKYF
jgi:hypothetical protein